MLLCGPISENIFGRTMQDFYDENKSFVGPYTFPRDIHVDRFVVRAIRNQIDSLIEDVKDKEMQLEVYQNKIFELLS